jgi:hypothetical protein
MKRFVLAPILTIASTMLAPSAVKAQWVTLTASHIQNSAGSPLASGKLCLLPVDNSNHPVLAEEGGAGGTVVIEKVCGTVAHGVLQSGLQAPDTALTSPLNLCLRVTITDSNNDGRQIYMAPCLQPASKGQASWCNTMSGATTCNFDDYAPANEINARFIEGVDCTGATDSSAALNALTGTFESVFDKKISFRGCSQIQLDHTWLIYGQSGTEIDLGPKITEGGTGGAQGGTLIFGCNGAAGPVIQFSRSGNIYFHGGMVEAKGSCPSHFTQGIEETNSARGGFTSTANLFANTTIESNAQGGKIPNFVGVYINGGPNQEEMKFWNVNVKCQGSFKSYGFWSTDPNADSTTWEYGAIDGCYRDVQNDGFPEGVRLVRMELGGAGYSAMGAGAALTAGRISLMDHVTCADLSGTLNVPSGSVGGGVFIANQCGMSDVDPHQYFINNGRAGSVVVQNNTFKWYGNAYPKNHQVIGSDSSDYTGGYGNLGSVIDLGNTIGPGLTLTRETYQNPTGMNPSVWITTSNLWGAAGSTSGFAALPAVGGNFHGIHTSALIQLIAPWTDSVGHNAFDSFEWMNYNAQSKYATLALDYKAFGSNLNPTPVISEQPPSTGLTTIAAGRINAADLTAIGTAGTTKYTYVLVPMVSCGYAAPLTKTITTGNVTLSSRNSIRIQVFPEGAWGVKIYRTGGGSSQGLIYTLTARDAVSGSGFMVYDTGLPADSSTPPTNTASTGCMANNVTQNTVSCSTSGSVVFSQPEQGGSYKKVIAYENACNGTATWAFPTAFSHTPQVLSQSLAATATSVSTTSITITGATSTGFLDLDGY